MKILYINWNAFMSRGVEKAMKKLGLDYGSLVYDVNNYNQDEKLATLLEEKIKTGLYHTVFSMNYIPVISNVCETQGIKYVSWVYDSPMPIRDVESIKNSCNNIWAFDLGMVEEYCAKGYPMKHLPLAVDTEMFNLPLSNNDIANYSSDVSMIGKLYSNDYSSYMSRMPEYVRGFLEGLIASQQKIYGGNIIRSATTEELVASINQEYQRQHFDFKMEKLTLDFMLECEVTKRERQLILSLLANHYDTKLYTSEDNISIPNLKVSGWVDYYDLMPKIFKLSKINLNITLRGIKTGIPLRAIDIMGSGGFLMSAYGIELGEYFKIGEECEAYQSVEELYEKVNFYTQNEDIRQKIIQNGLEKVKRDFKIEDRLAVMFN